MRTLSKSGLGLHKHLFIIHLQVMGDVQDKSNAYAALDEKEVDDYLTELFMESVENDTFDYPQNEPQCDCSNGY